MKNGVFQYKYIDVKNKIDKTQEAPKESFCRSLISEEVDDEDYLYAIKIWNTYNIKTQGDYLDL